MRCRDASTWRRLASERRLQDNFATTKLAVQERDRRKQLRWARLKLKPTNLRIFSSTPSSLPSVVAPSPSPPAARGRLQLWRAHPQQSWHAFLLCLLLVPSRVGWRWREPCRRWLRRKWYRFKSESWEKLIVRSRWWSSPSSCYCGGGGCIFLTPATSLNDSPSQSRSRSSLQPATIIILLKSSSNFLTSNLSCGAIT